MLEVRVIFIGEVQGVGFRASARLFAKGLGLKGYVKNLPDGSVELAAQGAKKDLEALLGRLKENFSISRMDAKWKEGAETYEDFQIRR